MSTTLILAPRIFRPSYGPDHEMMMTEETCVLSRDIALEFKPRLLPTAAVRYVDTPVTVAPPLCAACCRR